MSGSIRIFHAMAENKKIRKFTSSMQKKLVILFFLVMLAFACFLARIVRINRDNGDQYKRQVLSQQSYDSKVLPYKRGSITDRNGTVLAYSEKVYNVIVDSKIMHSEDDGSHIDATLSALKECFPEIDINEVRKHLNDNPTSQYKKFLRRVESPEVDAYNRLKETKKNDRELPEEEKLTENGVWFEEEYIRKYPYNSVACDTIGFVQGNNSGQYGLEEYYNDTLNGTNGREYAFLNSEGTLERTIKPAVDGKTLITTLDVNIQSIAEKHIREFAEEHKDGYRTGPAADNVGVIIMNPNNGEIYAMAGYPVFDLNDPRNMEGIDLSPYSSLLPENELSTVSGDSVSSDSAESQASLQSLSDNEVIKNAVWKNYCISDTYEPGSTMKPFTVAAAIDAGRITGYETYNCGGSLSIGEHVIHCHNRLGDGLLTVQQGIAKSCNVVLMDVAFALGKAEWLRYNRNFNFGLRTNVDLAGEVNSASTTFDERMGQTDLAVASFGQGFNVTMIQMISGFSALINGGYYYQPHLVSKVLNAEGAILEEHGSRVVKQVISGEVSDMIREDCNSVVMSEPEECTGWTARPAGYTMGGKTGTAEKLPRSAHNYLISFMGYSPAEDPQVICYVVIDHPNVADQSNSTRLATVMCKDIMTEVLPYLNIFPTLELTDAEKEELSEAQISFSVGSSGTQTISENTAEENPGETAEENGDTSGDAMVPVQYDDAMQPITKNVIQYDPETGYPLDPNTGEVLDPNTLLPIDDTVPSDLEY